MFPQRCISATTVVLICKQIVANRQNELQSDDFSKMDYYMGTFIKAIGFLIFCFSVEPVCPLKNNWYIDCNL